MHIIIIFTHPSSYKKTNLSTKSAFLKSFEKVSNICRFNYSYLRVEITMEELFSMNLPTRYDKANLKCWTTFIIRTSIIFLWTWARIIKKHEIHSNVKILKLYIRFTKQKNNKRYKTVNGIGVVKVYFRFHYHTNHSSNKTKEFYRLDLIVSSSEW